MGAVHAESKHDYHAEHESDYRRGVRDCEDQACNDRKAHSYHKRWQKSG
jgi:hypothetical protein